VLRAALLAREDPSEREIEWLAARYGEIDRAASAVGARVALLVFPFAGQLEQNHEPRLQAALVAIAERLGWLPVDLLPALRAAGRTGEPLFLDPWHPTPAGHAVVARAVARRLACAGLVRGAPATGCDAP
jgi:lysophospholipase L1-like esterase